ncbi:hypothetical protein F0562_015693 [Nyssa sinensis]|uniref:Zinc finger PMZ-type domain-containing protein n=1 Tax=Nyssa sinensis TaxID=561372 RepID=A0A5J4ZJK1_9ASTE|nr:hypothetical protein F0562_015693 [Nyssa sinensis]
MIRKKLMKRFEKKRDKMSKHCGLLCQTIQARLEKVKIKARHCQTTWAGNGEYKVECFGKQLVANLIEKTCNCRRWDITGVPYAYVVAAILLYKDIHEKFVDLYYHKETYLRAYTPTVHFILDSSSVKSKKARGTSSKNNSTNMLIGQQELLELLILLELLELLDLLELQGPAEATGSVEAVGSARATRVPRVATLELRGMTIIRNYFNGNSSGPKRIGVIARRKNSEV